VVVAQIYDEKTISSIIIRLEGESLFVYVKRRELSLMNNPSYKIY